MSAKPLVLAACCSGLFAPALALDLPSGWTSREENNLTHYQPQDIGDRVFIHSALTPLPDGGKRSADWLTAVAPQFAGQYGKVLEHGTAEQAGDLANMTYRVEVQGKPLHINFTAFPAGDGKMRLVQLLSEEDAALLQRYQDGAKAIIAGLYVEGEDDGATAAPASTADTTTASSSSSSSAAATVASSTGSSGTSAVKGGIDDGKEFMQTFKMDGLTPGGDLAFGDYQCAVQLDGGMKYTLSLYDNGEYRVSGDRTGTGEFKYERDGRINISSERFLYNYDYDGEPKEIAFFFRGKNGETGIYGQNIGDNIINICQYQGASKTASPAQQHTEAAEAARFKWTTAPGNGVAADNIEALLFYGYNADYGAGLSFEEEQRLVLKDGWAYDKLRVPPADLDVAASRKNEPKLWHKWRKNGKDYEIEKDGAWKKLPGIAVRGAKAGETLNRSYTYSASGGSYYGGYALFKTLKFKPDGTFDSNDYGSTHANSNGLGQINSEGIGHGAISHGASSSNDRGRYKLDGYTIEMTQPDGTTARQLFFFWADDKNISIGGATYSSE